MAANNYLNKIPVRGMRDILPQNAATREYLLNTIKTTAKAAGFHKIETPAIEHLQNLTSKDGGENETLIFKVLKRGESLNSALSHLKDTARPADTLCDSALRYDLTVPLVRFYANNSAELPSPFKSLQIGSVWRADAPQKGRFREFTQCDMDVIGDSSILAEISVLSTGLKILSNICAQANISGLTLHINDRRLLLAAVTTAGFSEDEASNLLIILDKNDKIGLAGVRAELVKQDYPIEKIDKFLSFFDSENPEAIRALNPAASENLKVIIGAIENLGLQNVKIVFDPALVRGMGYYTGPIFECTADGLGSSIAGGGRYDGMIGKYTDQQTPACGFSIGFERLCVILEDAGFKASTENATAILVGSKVPASQYSEIEKHAEDLRAAGQAATVLPMARNLGHQISTLENAGYTNFEKIYGD